MIFTRDYLWDSSFPLFRLEGLDSRKFLHGQTTSDILGIKEGSLIRTCWLSPTGRLNALLEVKLINENLYFIVLGGNAHELINGLGRVIFPSDKVEIIACENIRRIQIINNEESWKASTTEWILGDKSFPKTFNDYLKADTLKVREWMLRQGFLNGSNEVNGVNNPFELGLSDLVNLDKGCYLGQETLSKLKNIGKLKHQLRFFKSTREFSLNDTLDVSSEDGNTIEKAGFITSVLNQAPSLTIGLALIKRKYLSLKCLNLINDLGTVHIDKPIGFVDL
ncbi:MULTISPECIES: folate-binding protein YgfZ [unclassified Prochlorococcus]|uniref:CAF17-like 4Fe-4S cluster assembly/insertion protein YgfZ n=1 Tax=unclassified Prochlorococcus TaxID=2627481 RepID=UPI000533994A|nr:MULTISPECIES: folate-binding protein YgfZ [unclassified Prochlorococcus]KGG16651.1 Folate-dependent protein for Fe/S cluster synthesis/repair in oxidative stress [Prochlorococcus sp. MIT 0602]KGG18377.1 Folate-dependent protein for Fe/S cluster synthesis/repair in oxidative stress [Prochlorococcus sp. MIT 0603]